MHAYLRPMELFVGVVVLLSVASVPVPKSVPLPPQRPINTTARVEDLQKQAQAQSVEVSNLIQEIRRLSEILKAQQQDETSVRELSRHGRVAPHAPTQNLTASVRDGGFGATHGSTSTRH